MSESTFTIADAKAWLLGSACAACGTALPEPGLPCAACGVLPAMTAPEFEAELDSPVALAELHAIRLRAEARALQDQMTAKHREADRVLYLAGLEQRRTAAQGALGVATARQRELAPPLKTAKRAEAKARGERDQAAEYHAEMARAEETARRMKHGAEAETDAMLRLRTAAEVLARYESALSEATAARQQAETALSTATAQVEAAEAARDRAAREHEDCGRVPYGLETIVADMLRLLISGQLDPVEVVMARFPAQWVAATTGAADAIEAAARQRLIDEQDREKRDKPLHVRTLPDGQVRADPNLLHPGTPQPYHPPAPGGIHPAATGRPYGRS